mmetsp:Transcript_12890/g.14165  ORF Transcript_12890/g.14165 Transcript_12890/m.14165 type:complete len:119 (+) Transcript_12890:901-1257(+)
MNFECFIQIFPPLFASFSLIFLSFDIILHHSLSGHPIFDFLLLLFDWLICFKNSRLDIQKRKKKKKMNERERRDKKHNTSVSLQGLRTNTLNRETSEIGITINWTFSSISSSSNIGTR